MKASTKAAVHIAATSGSGSTVSVLAPVAAAVTVIGFVLVLIAAAFGAGQSEAATAGCGGGGTGQTVASIPLSAAQMSNVQTVVTTTAAMRINGAPLPAYAATVALATAYQESHLLNTTAQTDHDSEGLFQQRIQFYGADVAADPVKATQAFLTRLVRVANWQTIPLTDAAADVQNPRPDLRGAYAQWQPMAAALTSQLWPAARAANPAPTVHASRPPASSAPAGPAGSAPSTTIAVPSVACTGDDGAGGLAPAHGHGNNVAGTTHVPAGLVIDGITGRADSGRVRVGPAGQALRVRRGRPELLRLLRTDHGRVGHRGCHPRALDRLPGRRRHPGTTGSVRGRRRRPRPHPWR